VAPPEGPPFSRSRLSPAYSVIQPPFATPRRFRKLFYSSFFFHLVPLSVFLCLAVPGGELVSLNANNLGLLFHLSCSQPGLFPILFWSSLVAWALPPSLLSIIMFLAENGSRPSRKAVATKFGAARLSSPESPFSPPWCCRVHTVLQIVAGPTCTPSSNPPLFLEAALKQETGPSLPLRFWPAVRS